MSSIGIGENLRLQLTKLDSVQKDRFVRAGLPMKISIMTWVDVYVMQVGWKLTSLIIGVPMKPR